MPAVEPALDTRQPVIALKPLGMRWPHSVSMSAGEVLPVKYQGLGVPGLVAA